MKIGAEITFRCLLAASAALVLCSPAAFAELPDVPIPDEWRACETSDECGFVTEACRSCGTPISLNKKFLAAFDEADRKLREEKKMVLTCEACSQSAWKAACVIHRCSATMQIAAPEPAARP